MLIGKLYVLNLENGKENQSMIIENNEKVITGQMSFKSLQFSKRKHIVVFVQVKKK